MKLIISLMMVLCLSCGCFAQVANDNELNFMVIEPKSYEQKLLDSILKKYQVDESRKQLVIFCWGELAQDNFLLVDPPEPFSRNNIQNEKRLNRFYNEPENRERMNELHQEIDTYKSAIRKSIKELRELKKERELLIKRIELLKRILLSQK